MLPDRVSNPGPLTYESGALPIALRGPAVPISYSRMIFACILIFDVFWSDLKFLMNSFKRQSQ